MPLSIKDIRKTVPKKGRYENIREDPAQNNVLANMRQLYDAVEVPAAAGILGFPELQKSLKTIMDAADGKIKEAEADTALSTVDTWLTLVATKLDTPTADEYVKDAESRKKIESLIGHVAAGLDVKMRDDKYEPTEAQKKAAADKREADREACRENEEIEAREAMDRLKGQAAKAKKGSEKQAVKAENPEGTLNGRQVLDGLIAKGKKLPKEPQTQKQLEEARTLCLDIMATRRTIGALRNQPKLLDKDFQAADREKTKDTLLKSKTLRDFLRTLPYSEMRRLAADGHGGALEDRFKDYAANTLVLADDNLPEDYRPTALQRTEALQKQLDSDAVRNSFLPTERRDRYLELLATRAAVGSVRGSKKSLDVPIDPRKLRLERQKLREEPLSTALDRTIARNYANDAPTAAQQGHGGALEDMVRQEVRKMCLENRGGPMVEADKRYAPTYEERMADLEGMLRGGRLTKDQQLERALEAHFLSQRKGAGKKGARIGEIAELNRKVARTAESCRRVLSEQEAGLMNDHVKRTDPELRERGVDDMLKRHKGMIAATEREIDIQERLAQRPGMEELKHLAAEKLTLQMGLHTYNQAVKGQAEQEIPDADVIANAEEKLAKSMSDGTFRSHASMLEQDAAFNDMLGKLSREELVQELKGDGASLMDKFASAEKARKEQPEQAKENPKENAKEKAEQEKAAGEEGPQAGG